MKLKNKRAVVTGGGRDFGRAVSVWLAREGVEVDLCARKLSDASATCEIINGDNGTARAYQCDMTDASSVDNFAKQLINHETPIDIIVLSAAQWLEGMLSSRSYMFK